MLRLAADAALTRYRAAGERLGVPLDALVAVFHRPSGTTHLLAEPAPDILNALADEALTLAELMTCLGKQFDLVDADAAALAARLEELVAAGLVEAEPAGAGPVGAA